MERPVRADPISAWLSGVNTGLAGWVLYTAVVFMGSAIPQAVAGEEAHTILWGFAGQYLGACVALGWLCWVGWLAIPALGCYFYRFMSEDTPKRDLFIAFSITFFVFSSYAAGLAEYAVLVLIYAAVACLYWGMPWVRLRGSDR